MSAAAGRLLLSRLADSAGLGDAAAVELIGVGVGEIEGETGDEIAG